MSAHKKSFQEGVILYDSEACTEDMAAYLYATEIEQLSSSASFKISTQLQSPNEKDHARAIFKIAGIIIAAAAQGINQESFVKCYGVKTPISCTYMTLDKPFPLNMEEFEVGGKGGHPVKWALTIVAALLWQLNGLSPKPPLLAL